jgi:KUP system potassium uptake protein
VGAGIFAAALFYGDAIITPAISVLSAVEGLSVATPHLEHYVVPITVGILVWLFMIQKHGTGQVGRYFGPVTVLWFVTLAVLGVASIVQTPEVSAGGGSALRHRLCLVDKPHVAFILLAAVFLALTGGEACTPTWGTSAPGRCGWPGMVWCGRR